MLLEWGLNIPVRPKASHLVPPELRHCLAPEAAHEVRNTPYLALRTTVYRTWYLCVVFRTMLRSTSFQMPCTSYAARDGRCATAQTSDFEPRTPGERRLRRGVSGRQNQPGSIARVRRPRAVVSSRPSQGAFHPFAPVSSRNLTVRPRHWTHPMTRTLKIPSKNTKVKKTRCSG